MRWGHVPDARDFHYMVRTVVPAVPFAPNVSKERCMQVYPVFRAHSSRVAPEAI